MVETLLEAAARQADAAEVYLEESESRPIDFEYNELKYVHTKSRRAVSLRVIHEGRIGFASSTDLSQPQHLVETAVESARFGQEARFAFPGSARPADVAVHDARIVEFPVQEGIALGREAIDRVRAEFDDVLCSVEVAKWVGRTRLANTHGLDLEAELTGFDAYLVGLRVRDGSILWVSDGESSRALVTDFDRYTRKVIADIRAAQTERKVPSGTLPVLFTARGMALLLQLVQTIVNGKLVQKGASPLAGRLGEQVFDPRVSLYDDGTLDYGDGSSPHDGDGTPSCRTPLFERGVLSNYLFDLQTAGLMGTETTANSARPFASLPRPDASNLVLEAGDQPFDDLLAGLDRGLLVDEVIGGGQSNVLAGEFSVNVGLGFLVEKGQRVGRVKDCMIAGNLFEVFHRIRGIGQEQEVHGPIVAPAVCFDAVHVAGAG
ncbi:MAG: TldD/PmbA family protein [Candidatus Brocadiia bacterium]